MSRQNTAPTRVGIIGGGQLGRMFIENAAQYGLEISILENDPDSPAAQLCNKFVLGSIKSADDIRKFAEHCDVLTYEIEHIHADVLLELEEKGKLVIPSARILKTIQDKGLQKQFYQENNIPTSPFTLVNSPEEWLSAMKKIGGGRFAAKSRTGGYDGKGVAIVDTDFIEQNPSQIPFVGATLLEKFIDCKKELAVLVAIGQNGEVKTYPCVDMAFHPVSNLVTYLFTPAEISQEIELKAQELALKTVTALKGPGLFAVEFFLDHNDELWVNEMAPRPHNSAHHTIEAAYTSQFDQLLRILMNWPLGDTNFHSAGVMLNLTGPTEGEGPYQLEALDQILSIPGCYVHLYGKTNSKPHRKLGHITIIDKNINNAKEKAEKVEKIIKISVI